VITLVLVDDHTIVRQGLRALLSGEPDFRVVGEAEDGHAVVELVERLRPQVLVVDLMLPGVDGLEVARRITSCCPDTHVVVLTMHANPAYVVAALRAGALGFVLKDSDRADLVRAVRAAARGERYLGPPFSGEGLQVYLEQAAASPPDRYEMLTRREREVFHLAAEGVSNPEIARRLLISPRTVEDHRASVLRKLGLRNQTELVRYALGRRSSPLDSEVRDAEVRDSNDRA
jgi:DNA-binding NarL/FixJ family response regulator